MDPIDPVHGTGVLLAIALAAVVLLLVLIIRVKLHAFIALVLVSLLTAVATGIPLVDVPTALTSGFGLYSRHNNSQCARKSGHYCLKRSKG